MKDILSKVEPEAAILRHREAHGLSGLRHDFEKKNIFGIIIINFGFIILFKVGL